MDRVPRHTSLRTLPTGSTQAQGYRQHTVRDVVGYETDRYVNGYRPTAAANTYTLLPTSRPWQPPAPRNTSSPPLPGAKRCLGIAAGTIEWSSGPDNDGSDTYAAPRIHQMTTNVLNRFVAALGRFARANPAVRLSDVELGGTELDRQGHRRDRNLLDRRTSPSFQNIASVNLPPDTTSYSDTRLSAGCTTPFAHSEYERTLAPRPGAQLDVAYGQLIEPKMASSALASRRFQARPRGTRPVRSTVPMAAEQGPVPGAIAIVRIRRPRSMAPRTPGHLPQRADRHRLLRGGMELSDRASPMNNRFTAATARSHPR